MGNREKIINRGGSLGWYTYNGSKRLAGQCGMKAVRDLFFRSRLETHMKRVPTWIVLSCLGQLLFRHDLYCDDDDVHFSYLLA